MDADGRNKSSRLPASAIIVHLSMPPALSPDGTLLAFRSSRTGNSEIWISDVHGANARRLTNYNGGWCGSPDWSPDGTKIVFSRSDQPGGKGDLWLMDRDGTNLVQRTDTPDGDEYPLAWRSVPA
jgi:TolB protein